MASSSSKQDPATTGYLETMYLRYAGWLRARVVSQFGRQDADDLVQETWLRMLPSLTAEVRYPKALLWRVVRNLAIDKGRRRATKAREVAQATVLLGAAPLASSQIDQLFLKEVVLGLPQPLRDVGRVIDCYLALAAGRTVRTAPQCRAPEPVL